MSSTRSSLLRRWCILGSIAAVVLVSFALRTVAIKQEESRMDPVTGSMKRTTVWLFGFTSGPRVDVSPLESRLRRSGIAWTPSWKFLHNTHRTIFGNATCHACGAAPPIYSLGPVLGEFAAASTDVELREFVRVMESGTDAQQKAAVEAAFERGLQVLSSP